MQYVMELIVKSGTITNRAISPIGIVVLAMLLFSCKDVVYETNRTIIPLPNEVQWEEGSYFTERELNLEFENEELRDVAEFFVMESAPYIEVRSEPEDSGNALLVLEMDSITDQLSEESYVLEIKTDGIKVKAPSPSGVFYGLKTLKQLIWANHKENSSWALPVGVVKDSPRFAWRGLMLDESRHFFGMEKVKQLLDLMAEHKLNKFHWHLTDEPAWRIEIKAYPKLVQVGSIGDWSNSSKTPKFYTQEQIREVVDYAIAQQIEVIPEIDMPGHASAANRAYPEFSGGGNKDHPEFTYNPGKEETYAYLADILREVGELFPSEYIHIGGDEVNFANAQWLDDPEVRSLMRTNDLKDLKEVEYYFLNRISDSLKAMGKKMAGWDEISGSGVNTNSSLVFWWRHDKPDVRSKTIQNRYPTVLCPRIPMYLDFVQHHTHEYGRKWDGAFGDAVQAYHFPDSLDVEIPIDEPIVGIQACIWTERIANEKRLDFMAWPRLTAISEAAWTSPTSKSYDNFLKRLEEFLPFYEERNIGYFNLLDPSNTPEPKWNDGPNWQSNHESND
ncbi:beta-N-acetylhexosaminidase [Poritiphilus flavus]|uniref:beta-N-acetylhexosaminidase n=1 Tax=Poritiphilus flavus TaxID=2697053 RepID=A0A6L9E772_9FLAO|nr:family 20 glycosylhydrolase [Poritiphilus flavus]NAS10530.1 family 20 glycosylhydrolase [Poritiphilus flavus]